MSTCAKCGIEASVLSISTVDWKWYCRDCREAPVPRDNYKTTMTLKDGSSIGVGHYKDILSRRVDKDGAVYRDTGRKYFH